MPPIPEYNYFVFWGIIHDAYHMCEITALRRKYGEAFREQDWIARNKGVA